MRLLEVDQTGTQKRILPWATFLVPMRKVPHFNYPLRLSANVMAYTKYFLEYSLWEILIWYFKRKYNCSNTHANSVLLRTVGGREILSPLVLAGLRRKIVPLSKEKDHYQSKSTRTVDKINAAANSMCSQLFVNSSKRKKKDAALSVLSDKLLPVTFPLITPLFCNQTNLNFKNTTKDSPYPPLI